MQKVNAGGPGSGRRPSGQSDTPMYRIARGIYRGHLPRDASPEAKAAQSIEDRKTVARYGKLGDNLKQSISNPLAN